MAFLSAPWLWLYFSLSLFFLELMAPGFVIFFFGLSAATVGLLRFLLGETLSLTGQLAAFSVLSVVYLVFLRRFLKPLFSGKTAAGGEGLASDIVGRVGEITSPVAPPRTGRVLVGDAEWTAEAALPLDVGAPVKVVAQKNLTLVVESVAVGA